MTQAELDRQRDFALAANVYAIRLQASKFSVERDGAPAAYELARLHYATWCAASGKTAPGAA